MNTRLATRESLRPILKPPLPSGELAKTIKDSVNQQHHDDSDDELMTDNAFKVASKDLVHDLIYSLDDGHIDDVYENIIKNEYEKKKRRGVLEAGDYKKLNEKYEKKK